jgi:hypothetical protein
MRHEMMFPHQLFNLRVPSLSATIRYDIGFEGIVILHRWRPAPDQRVFVHQAGKGMT